MTKFPMMAVIILADILIWSGLYYLALRSYIRERRQKGISPDLRGFKVNSIICFIVVHLLFIWLLYGFKKWGGPH